MDYANVKLNMNINSMRFQIYNLVIFYEDVWWAEVENKFSCPTFSNIKQNIKLLKIFILFIHILNAVWSTLLNNMRWKWTMNLIILI